MPINIDQPVDNPVKTLTFGSKKKNKRAAKTPTKIPNPLESGKTPSMKRNPAEFRTVNPSMDDIVTTFAKSVYNPQFEKFEAFVDTVRKEVRKTVDYRKSVNDDSPVSLAKYTDDIIKKILRSSKWA